MIMQIHVFMNKIRATKIKQKFVSHIYLYKHIIYCFLALSSCT